VENFTQNNSLAKVSIKDYIKAIDGNIMEEFSLE
jgi:hypothetical protein